MATVNVLMRLSTPIYEFPEWWGKPLPIECKDWDPKFYFGRGFYGITKNINDYNMTMGSISQVIEVDDNPDNFIDLGDRVKFRKGIIIYQGRDHYRALRMIFDSDYEMGNWIHFRITYIKPEYQTEEMQLLAVKKHPHDLEYCYNPSYEVMIEAVRQNGDVIQYIKREDQTEELQLLAITKDYSTISYCYNPSYKVMLESVKKHGSSIYYIKPEDQTEELQLLAVNKHRYAIIHCHNPSYKVKQLHKELWGQ